MTKLVISPGGALSIGLAFFSLPFDLFPFESMVTRVNVYSVSFLSSSILVAEVLFASPFITMGCAIPSSSGVKVICVLVKSLSPGFVHESERHLSPAVIEIFFTSPGGVVSLWSTSVLQAEKIKIVLAKIERSL